MINSQIHKDKKNTGIKLSLSKVISRNLYQCIILFLILISGIFIKIEAQEISNIGKSPILDLNGGVSINQVYFHSGDTLSSRQPYAYTVMANLNVSVYGWSVPVSAMYSNQNWSYQQPFNQFSLHPSYKWIRTHIGYSSMSFSPYTLSGHQFLGGGVELTPGNSWKISAMSGRMQKRVLPDTSGRYDAAYQRFGSGVKAEYTHKIGTVGFDVFYARDKESSLPVITDSASVLPQENLSMGLNTNFRFLQKFAVVMNYGVSTLTENTLTPEGSDDLFLPLIKTRESTRQYHAFKSNLNYTTGFGQFGLGFERIDPGFRTLGAYYSRNDFVNYTLNYSGGMWQNKVALSLNAGLQTDDLNSQKDQKTNRRVGNFTISFTPNTKFGANFMYSNFQNYTNVKTGFENINTSSPYGNLDTLDFTQISESFNTTFTYRLGGKDKTMHNINLTGGYQKASQQQSDNPNHSGSKFYTAMGGYTMNHKNTGLSSSLMANYSRNIADTLINQIVGPSISMRKSFFDKKLKTALMYSYNISQLNGRKQSENSVIRATAGYSLQKHVFNLNGVLALRKKENAPERGPDITVTLTYSYNFGWTPGKKNKSSEKSNNNE